MKSPKLLRSFMRLEEDCVLPIQMSSSLRSGPDDSREHAVVEVLCRIPKRAYGYLASRIDYVRWFIPHCLDYGSVTPFFCPPDDVCRLIYLSPELEQQPYDLVVAVVAHEVGHIVLDHDLSPKTPELYEAQEKEAFRTICKWGFGKEARLHQKSIRDRAAKERKEWRFK